MFATNKFILYYKNLHIIGGIWISDSYYNSQAFRTVPKNQSTDTIISDSSYIIYKTHDWYVLHNTT